MIASRLFALAVFAILAWGSTIQAQSTIASDRPGFATGSATLDHGRWQLESGIEIGHGNGETVGSLGQVLLRYGLGTFEMRAQFNSLVVGPRATEPGLQDVSVGLKSGLARSPSGAASLSLLAAVSLPTGSDRLTADRVVPSAALLYDVSLGGSWSLSLNGGYTLGTGPLDDVGSVVITPGFAIPGTRLGTYLAYAGFFSSSDLHYLESGLTLLARSDLQLDLNGGVELDSGTVFLGGGVSIRWR